MALWELGQEDQAVRHLTEATTREDSPSDAQADGAWILGATGAVDDAWLLLGRAARGAIDGAVEPGAHACVQYSRVLVSLVAGNCMKPPPRLKVRWEGSIELDAIARHASLAAMVAVANGHRGEAVELADDGLRVAIAQGAGHWEHWLRLLRSVASGHRDEYRRSLLALLTTARLSTLALAGRRAARPAAPGCSPVSPRGLRSRDGRCDGCQPSEPRCEVRTRLWRRRRRNFLPNTEPSTMSRCSALTSDSHVRPPTRRVLGRQLARHANPTLMLHDLGHIAIDIGHRRLLVSQTRRRTASLLAFSGLQAEPRGD